MTAPARPPAGVAADAIDPGWVELLATRQLVRSPIPTLADTVTLTLTLTLTQVELIATQQLVAVPSAATRHAL